MPRMASVEDPYRPFAPHLALGERLEELAMAHVRRGVVRLLKEQGFSQVLDLACGTGPFARQLADAGIWPVGLDASPTMLASAAAKGRRPPTFPVVLGDAGRLPFRPGAFDAAVMSLALHEMAPGLRERAWSETRRTVRLGGWIVLVDFGLPAGSGVLGRCAAGVIHAIERGAGKVHPPHYQGYLGFMGAGGLPGWLAAHGARVVAERRHFWGAIRAMAAQV